MPTQFLQDTTQADKAFSADLVAWYQKNHRVLPWRETRNPYFIWLSEVMLQQTQVKTVIDYYHRFIQTFPTIEALAMANPETVLKQWEGLGYYARCRNLQKAAQMILQHFNGEFPQSIEAVQTLPGIGKSTAGAILTFAFGQKHPLLDGNVKRVLSRLYDIDQPIESPAVLKQLWALSSQLVNQAEDAFSYNQGIMELGATLCLPKKPQCLICPFQNRCLANLAGTQHARPVKKPKAKIPHYNVAAGIIWNQHHEVLIQQRAEGGLLAGLWEFPGGKQEAGETLEQTIAREIAEELSIVVSVKGALPPIHHAYTHFKITLYPFHCQFISGVPTLNVAQNMQWCLPKELGKLPFPKANIPIIQSLSGFDVTTLSMVFPF